MPRVKKIQEDALLEKITNIEKLLTKIIDENDKILQIDEVCEYLGLSKSYLYKLTMNGKIRHYKPMGKKLYFSKKEVDKWVKENIPDGEVL